MNLGMQHEECVNGVRDRCWWRQDSIEALWKPPGWDTSVHSRPSSLIASTLEAIASRLEAFACSEVGKAIDTEKLAAG